MRRLSLEPEPQKQSTRPAPGILLLPRPRAASGEAKRPSSSRTFSVPAGRNRAAELGHDARNLFSALNLYCELLAVPGVLSPGFAHYADDLRVLGESGARLLGTLTEAALAADPPTARRPFPGIDDLASELADLEAPLRALAGPGIRLEVECAPCAGELALNSEDLLRMLFNLVANTVEAGLAASARRASFLRITAQRGGAASFLAQPSSQGDTETVVLSVRDNGPGIPESDLPHIFDPGFSTRRRRAEGAARGLGLTIVRQLAEAAGGAVRAISSAGLGTRFDIELPVVCRPRSASSIDSNTPFKAKFSANRRRGWNDPHLLPAENCRKS